MREFLKCFNQAALEVPTATPEVKINALINVLRDGDLFSSIAKKSVRSFDDLLNNAEKYVILEEIRKAQKAEMKPIQCEWLREFESKRRKSKTRAKPSHTNVVGPWSWFEKYMPLRIQPVEVLEVAGAHPEMKFPLSRS